MSCHSTHAGVAATRYAREVSDLDEAQVAHLFHKLKRASREEGPREPVTPEEAVAALQSVRMRAEHDLRLSDTSRTAILGRLDKAVAHAQAGDVPDQDTLNAMSAVTAEADLAATELDDLLITAAAAQRCSPDRMRARFSKWRRDPNTYEDVTAPDPNFDGARLPAGSFIPADKATMRALRKLGWENYLAQPLPVFVYGTLRSGQGNSHLINEDTVTSRNVGTAAGVGIYGANWGFPYAQDDPTGTAKTVGELVDLDGSWEGHEVRESLDGLEGFSSNRPSGNHYHRVIRPVSVPGQREPVNAWVYLMAASGYRTLEPEDLIADGDWVAARRQSRYTSQGNPSGWTVVDDEDVPARSAERSASTFQNFEDVDDPDNMFAGMSESDIAARYRAGGY
ncbi:MAG: gamma-glutamylcyclotransferase family protein [Propionicimonas sp.]